MKVPLSRDESKRLQALRNYRILDSEPEQSFDDLSLLAARICEAPFAMISLVEEERRWFKSTVGTTVRETPRDGSFCAHAILQSDVFVVRDALADERFANHPHVTTDPKIRFYAGAPLVTPDGYRIGMLCVADRIPRDLRPDQMEALRILSRQVMTRMELRRNLVEFKEAVEERQRTEESLHQRTDFLQLQQVVAAAANEASTVEDAMQAAIDLVCAYTGWPIGHVCLRAEDSQDELVSTGIWYLTDSERFGQFRQITDSTRFTPGIGLPGLVLAKRKPVWLRDVEADPDFARVKVARQLGIKIGFAFPVMIGSEVAAVLEFFAETYIDPNERLLQVVSYVGTQMGRVIERKQSQKALAKSEELFRSLIEHASDIISILEADGTIRYESPAIEQVLGYKAEEMVGRNAFEFVHPDDLIRLKQLYAEGLREPGTTQTDCYRYRHKNGSWRAFESTGTNLLTHPSVHGIIINSRDVTERTQAETSLRYRWEFEKLITTISGNFINIAAEDVDSEINRSLQAIGEFAGADRSYVFQFSPEAASVTNTHEWCRRGIDSHIHRLQNLPVQSLPWIFGRLRRGETVNIPHVADLPPEAGAEKTEFEQEDIQSLICVPMVLQKSVIGFLGFDAVAHDMAWTEDLIALLKITGELLVSALRRKQTEEALRTSEERFRNLIESTTDLVWEVDAKGVYTYVSPRIEQVLGYRPEEVLGRTPFDIMPESEAKRISAFFADVAARKVPFTTLENTNRHKNGRLVVLESSGMPILDAVGGFHGYRGIDRDITERKAAEGRLLLQSAALESAANGIVITDRDGTILWVNPAFTKLTGYTAEESIGKNPRVLKSGQHDEAFYRHLWQTVRAGNVWRGELVNRRKDSSLYTEDMTITPVRNHAGVITNYIAIKQDVTARKRAEAVLKHRADIDDLLTSISTRFINLDPGEVDRSINESLQTLGSFVGVDRSYMFILSDDHATIDNTHEWCAPGIEAQINNLQAIPVEAYGWVAERLMRFESVHVPRVRDLPREADDFRKLCEAQQIQSLLLVPIVYGQAPFGFLGFDSVRTEKTWAEEDVILLKMIGEIFVNALKRERAELALQDSNRKLENTLDELKRTQQQIVQQERLRALGQMASGIAHDFNNALSPILGFSELLLARPSHLDDRDKARHFLQMMNTAAKDAASIVNRLREFYRNRDETDKLAPVNLVPLVEQAISLTQPRWKVQAQARGINIRVHPDLQKVPLIAGSEPDLRELLTNLIFNAVDAMPQGGVVTITTRPQNGHVVLTVADTGTGMTDEVRRRCMDPFFTTKGKAGTGLGLSMVHGIVRRHEGKIEIETSLGKGTTFTIRLPVQSRAVARVDETPTVRSAVRSVHVLVVDDEPMVREIESEYLKAEGHTVEVAASGPEGLEKFRATRFDVVVLDRAMPVMSGDQLAVAIKEIAPRVPVILLSGFGSMMQAAGEKPDGVDYVLGKPVTLQDLAQTVARAIENEIGGAASPDSRVEHQSQPTDRHG